MGQDQAHAATRWLIDKWDADALAWAERRLGHAGKISAALFERFKIRPYATVEIPGNILVTAGLTRLTSLLTGAGGVAITNTTARIGVGDGSTAANVADTDLSAGAGSTHRWFQIMDATYPQTSAGVLTLKSTFASADGNFAWAEFCTDITAATVASANTVGTTLFNRKVSSQGTKVSGNVWAATCAITFS